GLAEAVTGLTSSGTVTGTSGVVTEDHGFGQACRIVLHETPVVSAPVEDGPAAVAEWTEDLASFVGHTEHPGKGHAHGGAVADHDEQAGCRCASEPTGHGRSEEHTSELQARFDLV